MASSFVLITGLQNFVVEQKQKEPARALLNGLAAAQVGKPAAGSYEINLFGAQANGKLDKDKVGISNSCQLELLRGRH